MFGQGGIVPVRAVLNAGIRVPAHGGQKGTPFSFHGGEQHVEVHGRSLARRTGSVLVGVALVLVPEEGL